MKNREVYQRDPSEMTLVNDGVVALSDAMTEDRRRTLRFELEHFVCEGEYRRGLVRILDSYLSNQGQPMQPAAWVSGFFGSGKSHLAKMLHFLWTDYTFPEDGATARGLAHLPTDVLDPLTEITNLGKRGAGLHAAAGTLGSGAGDSVRLEILGIAFRSAGLPEGYPQARFCLWLKQNDIFEQVSAAVEADGRDFQGELNAMYVSPRIAEALLSVDPSFAGSELEARAAIRAQFPKPDDISEDEFTAALRDALSCEGEMPHTAIILDEVQQYIGDDTARSFAVQAVVQAVSKGFGDRLLFLGTGQTALSGMPALQRLQGRFTVNVQLSDTDVETVTRRVVLAKREDRVEAVKSSLEDNTGEVDRHLVGTNIGPRGEDKAILVDDYPLLPVRRRFWEHSLRAVDRAGTAGQLRTQLRIVYEAIKHTADEPLGTVVPADFLFEQISANLLQSGELLREVHQAIASQDDGTPDGRLKSRLCALVFLIRKLPREAGADIGVRATHLVLADLMVSDLARDGAALRGRLPKLLDELVDAGTLMKLEDEYSLQTREGSEWEAEFRNRQSNLANNLARMGEKRGQLVRAAVQDAVGSLKLRHGQCKEPRKLALHFGVEPPQGEAHHIPVWIRDGWGATGKSILTDARAAGIDSPTIHVFVPKREADALARTIAAEGAAKETLDFKGVPATPEGLEARQGMETRLSEARNSLRALVTGVVDGARVYQGGGGERSEATPLEKVREAAHDSLDRLFHEFGDADDSRWPKVIERARKGDHHSLAAVDHTGKAEEHSVCSAVLALIGSGKKGKEVRAHFSAPPFGWPRDAIDGGLMALVRSGHLRASLNGTALKLGGLDQAKVPRVDFRVESAIIDTPQRLEVRRLISSAGVPCKAGEEVSAADRYLDVLLDLAQGAGGEAPLPQRPDFSHLMELQSLAGTERLLAMLERHDELAKNYSDWTRARDLAAQRQPAYERLLSLADHADDLDVAGEVRPQIEAIEANRSLLEATDPVPGLTRKLADALRVALAEAERGQAAVFDDESARLDAAESWQKLGATDRDNIMRRLHVDRAAKGATGTEDEVLESLGRISLGEWRTRTAALPQLFAQARAEAATLLEPEISFVKLDSGTLRTPEQVKAWLTDLERDLLERIEHGPIAVS